MPILSTITGLSTAAAALAGGASGLGRLGSVRRGRAEGRRQFDEQHELDEKEYELRKLLAMQAYRKQESNLDWKRRFRNAMMGGSRAV